MMKRILKITGRVIGIGFLFLIFLGMLASCFGGEEDTPVTTPKQEVNEDRPKDKPKEEKPKEQPKAKIGDTLQVGDVEFSVKGKSEATNVGGQYGKNAKGKFLVLDVEVTNKGADSFIVDSSLFKLKVDGKEYEADGGAGIYANQESDFFLSEINPDITIKGKVVFDIPAELMQKDLTLNVQAGLFDEGEIQLK